MLIDTHCHLSDDAFAADRPAVLERMRAAGVARAVVIESDPDRLDATLPWLTGDPTLALATACHPHDAAKWSPAWRDRLERAWAEPSCRAVGEIGLDYHYDHSPRDVQRRVFAEQLQLASDRARPVIIHAREADADVVAVIGERPGVPVVLHSFSSGPVLRDAGLARGWYFSFSGMVTFRSWQQADTVALVPGDRLLLETDAPYLAPVPHRGHRNEPAWVAEVADAVAAQRGTDGAEIAALTSANAHRLFWPGDGAAVPASA